eukprot:TRINITY_DN30381_c0_g1_i1.p1 TRINITY_DN30381_c0_g1~~TRINITY_DN30381_c0_g1_i1.p1  ORF type:complete len:1562 (+),score=444.99 TRINITY_DN30381_c0_g1_i1:70-4755(+)
MWVWPTLGYDHVHELPHSCLDVLGRRCRSLSEQPARPLKDQHGQDLEVSLMPGPLTSAKYAGNGSRAPSSVVSNDVGGEVSWRLSKVSQAGASVRVCVPGLVDLHAAPKPFILEAGGAKSPHYTFQEALADARSSGGGFFVYRVPMVTARLRDDIAAECGELIAPNAWNMYVTSASLGAELDVQVAVGDAPPTEEGVHSTSMANMMGRSSREGWFSPTHESPVINVTGSGFKLSIVQRGGPPIDPSRLHGQDEEQMEGFMQQWAGKAMCTRPGTWRVLSVNSQPAATEDGGLPMDDVTQRVCSKSSKSSGEQGSTVDVVLAATALADIAVEPFVLGYGEAHVCSLCRMFEEEVADVLSIAPEQVMCGEFLPKGHSPGRKHIRQNCVSLRFSLLHGEVTELRSSRDNFTLPKKLIPGRLASLRGTHTDDLTESLGTQTLRKLALQGKPKNKQGKLSGSNSLPMLSTQSMIELRALTMTPPLSGREDSEKQPDLLLRRLVAILTDRKHAMRRHPDAFPMLTKVLKGGLLTTAMLVAGSSVATYGNIAHDLRSFMREQRTKKKEALVDRKNMLDLSTKRLDVMAASKTSDERLMKFEEFKYYSPPDLLNKMEASFPLDADLAACLDVLLLWTATDKDANGKADQCIKLKHHNIIERMINVMVWFKRERLIIFNCVAIVTNLTKHDIGCVDRIVDKCIASEFLIALGNFPKDHAMQQQGAVLLRRLYLRVRETSKNGPRVITLGVGVDEVWTFRGVDRILETMALYEEDEDIQNNGCLMLASLAELLYNNGKAADAFGRIEAAMAKHAHRPDILRYGIQIISRLGPSFLVHDHRGVKVIVVAMEKHRSDVELQRAGAMALFMLAKTEEALRICRRGGGIGAMLLAMFSHSCDSQVLQTSTMALEKHCPIALSSVFSICGDLVSTLPPLLWQLDPLDGSGKSLFNIAGMKASGDWKTDIIDKFLGEVLAANSPVPPAKDPSRQLSADGALGKTGTSAASADVDLDNVGGYRRAGLRDEIDALDAGFALPGPLSSGLLIRELSKKGQQLEKDIEKLKEFKATVFKVDRQPDKQGGGPGGPNSTGRMSGRPEPTIWRTEVIKHSCETDQLLVPGPKDEQLKKMVDDLQKGLTDPTKNWSAHDAELIILLCGHYAWHSYSYARTLTDNGIAKALIGWLTSQSEGTFKDPTRMADSYPLQRACLGAIASLCKHGLECAEPLLDLQAAQMVLGFTNHLEISIRRNATRCVARMIPHASARKDEDSKFGVKQVWDLILRDLYDTDDTLRTTAAACGLEAVYDGWASEEAAELAPLEEFSTALVHVLQGSTPTVDEHPSPLQSSCALPVLLTMAYLVKEEVKAAQELHKHEQLLRLLMRWLPAGSPQQATSVDQAAAAGAAHTLEALSNRGAMLGAEDMEALLRHGSSDSATAGLRAACRSALEPAIQREDNVEVLAQLFATRIPRPGGTFRLAHAEVLQLIVDRIVLLLRNAPDKMSDRLASSLESAEPLLPRSGDAADVKQLHKLFNEAKYFGTEEADASLSRGQSQADPGLGSTAGSLPGASKGSSMPQH